MGRRGRGGEEGHSASLAHRKPAATLEMIRHTSLLDRRGDLPYCITSFPITCSLSILINAHSMLVINNPFIINDQIKSVSEIIISHYIINNYQLDFQHHVYDEKCATMDHEGPSMSAIIYMDHQLTSFLMFTSIPRVERRRSTQVE